MARNPVVFSNGILQQKAQVEIDGTVYEVEPAQYEGTTPLSATNLNLLQTRLYDYIDENSNYVKLTGDMNKTDGENKTTFSILIDYPEGYGRDNTSILECAIKFVNIKFLLPTMFYDENTGVVNGRSRVILSNLGIIISVTYDYSTDYPMTYEIVILKK